MMKRFLFSLGIALIAGTAAANTPEIASRLQAKLMKVGVRVQTKVAYYDATLTTGDQPVEVENRRLNRKLEKMYRRVFRAADLFGDASELLPGRWGRKTFRQGCRTLGRAHRTARQGLHIAQDWSIPSMIDEFTLMRRDILDALEECY